MTYFLVDLNGSCIQSDAYENGDHMLGETPPRRATGLPEEEWEPRVPRPFCDLPVAATF